MPKELKEIRNFTEGTIFNASEKDIPADSNVFSLNINPTAEHGILDAIKSNRLISTIDGRQTSFKDPVSWSATDNIDASTGSTTYNYPNIWIDDISVLDTDSPAKINFIGTKGRKEQLTVHNVEPLFVHTGTDMTLASELVETDEYIHVTADITSLDEGDYFSIETTGGGAFTGRAGHHEIFQMKSYDSATKFLHVKRRCFGTSSDKISTSTVLDIHANMLDIGGTKTKVKGGTAILSGWSDYSGNNIGGNSHYLNYSDNAERREKNGAISCDNGTRKCEFNAGTKTLTFGADVGEGDINFHEGDIVTFYYYDGSRLNNGKSFTILKKATSPVVLTLDDNLGDTLSTETVDSTFLYIESNLIKNFTFSHRIGAPSNDYKINDWQHRSLALDTSPTPDVAANYYGANITLSGTPAIADGVIWGVPYGDMLELTDENPPYGQGANVADYHYPFDNETTSGVTTNSESFLRIRSYYDPIKAERGLKVGTTLTTSSTEFEFTVGTGFSADMGLYLAKGDIINFENVETDIDGDTEYMEVLSVGKSSIKVSRGALGSTPEASNLANGREPFKCVNHSIIQSIAKEKLKEGQEYVLSFYSHGGNDSGRTDDPYAYGGLAITFNGGYVNSSGVWTPFNNSSENGYLEWGETKKHATEYRWINFNQLNKPHNDEADNEATGLDEHWRKFDIRFTIPKGQKLDTDVDIEFASRGRHESNIGIDRVTMFEHTKVYVTEDNGNRISNAAFLDNSGVKVLAIYDSNNSSLSAIDNFDINTYSTFSSNTPTVSANTSSDVVSSRNSASFIKNNRELHIGFGGSASDSPPQWLGYVNHKVFGQDFTGQLYQEEDTVHAYDDSGMNALSKICLAGEFEQLTVSYAQPDLTVTFTHAGIVNVGDNIVVREWLDVDNSWTGNGVWVVTDTTTATTSFKCRRDTDYDLGGSDISAPSNNKISFRPYYYYGCIDGDDRLYRITPSTRILEGLTLDTVYTAGKMEASMPLPGPIASICTCYNKNDDGTGGGRVYGLSSTSDEVYVIDVNLKHSEWKSVALNTHTLGLNFKSFKWSNDSANDSTNSNGDIGGSTGVFGGLASESTPTISYAGSLSDIIETKGTNKNFNIGDTVNANTPNEFDTRLWVQCAPSSGGSFTEGSRFLFCGLTNTVHDSAAQVYLGDRTPPTTSITGTDEGWRWTKYDGAKRFKLGVGYPADWNDSTYGKYGYFTEVSSSREINKVGTLKTPYPSFEASSNLSAGDGYNTSFINFGQNVGWYKDNYSDDSDKPSIEVAKYGLFQMADNDMDGLIDGTGVVCANNKSFEPNGGSELEIYGTLHQRVTSHMVGLIGKSNSLWVREAGSLHSPSGTGFYFGGGYDTASGGYEHQDTPENTTVGPCVFVCSDIHFGDNLPISSYYAGETTDDDTGAIGANAIKVELDATAIKVLQAGDLVFCQDAGPTSGSETLSADNTLKSFNTYIAAIERGEDFIVLPVPADYHSASYDDRAPHTARHLRIYPHSQHSVYYRDSADAADDETTFNGSLLSTSTSEWTHGIYHHAYDNEDNMNGDIFTDGYGCGKYGRTFLTAPSVYGFSGTESQDSVLAGFSYNAFRPGILFNIDKLNFKAGYMIRPFSLDNNDFANLAIGNNISVQMPCFPTMPIYHVEKSSNTHYAVDDSNVNNQFASNLFILSKNEETTGTTNECSMYQVDMSFLYPEEALHQALDATTSGTTDDYSAGSHWDIMMAGSVISYIDTDSTSYEDCIPKSNSSTDTIDKRQFRLNAERNPIVTIKGGTSLIYGASKLGTDSPYRNEGALAGLCISIVDGTTGKIQTRYINWSNNVDNGSDNGKHQDGYVYCHVHYPFQHTPDNSDKFYIWKHSNVCTAPVRLNKETELTHGLPNAITADPILSAPIYAETNDITGEVCSIDAGTATCDEIHFLAKNDLVTISGTSSYEGPQTIATVPSPKVFTFETTGSGTETGIWTADESSAVSNPLLLSLSSPTFLATFGGLDMRKLRGATISSIAEGGGSANDMTVTASANHFFDVGDTVTIDSGVDTQDGTYIVTADNGTTTFDVANTVVTTSTGPVTTNQWESVLFESGGNAGIGELRAGFNNWDKGNIQSNLIRHDSSAIADIYMAFTEGSVNIVSASSTDTAGVFLKNNTYSYKVSLIYDGYQEGPLSQSTWAHSDTSARTKYNVTIKVSDYSNRLSHICLYRRNDSESFFSLVKEIPVESGWGNSNGVWNYTVPDTGELGATYESRSGLSEVLDTIKLKYGLSEEIDGYLFAGDCGHESIENASNLIFRSKPGKFSIFDYANDFLVIKSKPTAMANFLGRLFVFDNNNIYKVNPHNLAIEDTFEGIGCLGKDSLIVTEYGMFFADSNGAYKHDGSVPIKISEPIQSGGGTTTFFHANATDNINDSSWNNMVTNRGNIPFVTFDSNGGNVLFVIKDNDKSTFTANSLDLNKNVIQHYTWSFNIARNRWDLWEIDSDVELGAPIINTNGEIILPIDNALYEMQGGSDKKDYTWISKKINADDDSTVKIFKKVKVNGIENNLNLAGNNKESSNRLFISTNKGAIAYSDMTHSMPSLGHSDYKLSSSNKSARWMQIKLEDMTEPIDSLGIIFRRKRVK